MKDEKVLIYIVQNRYGFTKKEARNYLKQISQERKDIMVKGFYESAKQSFCQD